MTDSDEGLIEKNTVILGEGVQETTDGDGLTPDDSEFEETNKLCDLFFNDGREAYVWIVPKDSIEIIKVPNNEVLWDILKGK